METGRHLAVPTNAVTSGSSGSFVEGQSVISLSAKAEGELNWRSQMQISAHRQVVCPHSVDP